MKLLDKAISHSRATLSILVFILVAGFASQRMMTLEVSPNVNAPFVIVSVFHDGISPEDAVRLLIKPMETELKSVEGIKEIKTYGNESLATAVIEFEIERDSDAAIQDVRVAVDRAQAKFPADTEEPVVQEATAAKEPTLVITFSGKGVMERELFQIARRYQDKIEALPSVLEANLSGSREEVVEAVIDQSRLERYNLQAQELYNAVVNNNRLIPAGEYDTAQGRFGVKVPALIETRRDVYNLPLRFDEQGVVTLGDVAEVRRTFKDASGFSHINGKSTISLTVSKRDKFNEIDTAEAIKAVIDEGRDALPANVDIIYIFDRSEFSYQMISELSGNILTAVVLVLIIVVAALGVRSGLLVGFGIPFSLLGSAIILQMMGFSFNFMVAFGLLLALGMLIDGAIVVVEYADRQRSLGKSMKESYLIAVQRMRLPVISSTATTLLVFLPLMLWPGTTGEFMSYLPVTVFAVLVWSLIYALFFSPVVGTLIGRAQKTHRVVETLQSDSAWPQKMTRFGQGYSSLVGAFVRQPVAVFASAITLLFVIFAIYGQLGRGAMFFTETENNYGKGSVRAKGNLSVVEREQLTAQVEKILLSISEVKAVYSASGGTGVGDNGSARYRDEVAEVLIELVDASERERSSREVFASIREATAHMPGIFFTADAVEGGPPTGRDVQLQLASANQDKLFATARMIRRHLEESVEGLRDIEDTTPQPGIEWEITIDRAQAAMQGVNVSLVGQMVQMITNGVLLGKYRPDDAEDEVDIRVRYPNSERSLTALEDIRVTTAQGPVPIASFVKLVPQQKVDSIQRIDLEQVAFVRANTLEGVLADTKVKEIQQWLETVEIDPAVQISFRGANEEQAESGQFLATAGVMALFLMLIMMVMQFNSFYQAFLILSAVIMSTAGVLLGLVFSQQPFSIIMTGVGIIALAGIVVNNNIVLIDTYNHLRRDRPDMSPFEAAHLSAVLRLRPVLLTTVTTVVGLMPLANGFSVDFLQRSAGFGGAVTSWWTPLASAIVDGLVFSTLLTLLVTPALIVMPQQIKRWCTKGDNKPAPYSGQPGGEQAPGVGIQ
ncbi:MAG: efflux RND transporter permease subunit [Porticoccaceae bacterium]|nr:efflux RND transporter permease subunit [Porticoccaceae bacterium]